MNERQKETLRVRIISVGFSCLAFAVFKPIGMGELGLMLYVHLLVIWGLGVGICFLTEAIMKYILGLSATFNKGAEYIIRRNLWFQLINSPLEALLVCAYLHFPMSCIAAPSPLSWKGYLQVLLILAFCSFAIGLYWRYKYRSRYLADELEETKMLNENLRNMQQEMERQMKDAEAASVSQDSEKDALTAQPDSTVTLTGTTNESVTLKITDLLYIEAVGNYLKVCQWREDRVRTDMLRATSKQIEDDLHNFPMIVRCHRAFLVNLAQVERIVSRTGAMQLVIKHCNDTIPVSRSNMSQVKKAIKSMG